MAHGETTTEHPPALDPAAAAPTIPRAEPSPRRISSTATKSRLALMPRPLERGEIFGASCLVAAGLLVRALAVLHHRVNSDEPQHLHVAWAWTQGLLPYRDVFDNHSPLFSLLMSLPLRAFGERPDIVVLMRLWMLPFALGSLALTAVLARRLFTPRVALWSVALLGALPDFTLASVEYRTDVPWMFAWLTGLAVLASGRLSRSRAFGAGLLFGVALSISMKTSLLVVAAAAAAGLTWLCAPREQRPPWRRLTSLVASVGVGLLLVPLLLIGAFARLGALQDLLRGAVGYNLVPGLGLWGTAPLRPLGFFLGLPAVIGVAAWVYRAAPNRALAGRRTFFLVSTGLAHLAIETLWPLVVRSDLLPLLPVECVFLVALAASLPWPAPAKSAIPGRRMSVAVAALVLVAAHVMTIRAGRLWSDETRVERRVLAELLHLTRPDDLVMDVKGESVFRRRPIPIAIESIAEELYRRGELRDDIPERLAQTGTAVVVQDYARPYPPRAWAFMQSHYLPVGGLRVLGQYLDPSSSASNERRFLVSVPQSYALFGAAGPARGVLDGLLWSGPRRLTVGPHLYRAAPGEGQLALVWAPAIERGYASVLLPDPPLTLDAQDRVLVLAPHPDDETVANGGLLLAARRAGAAIRVVWGTDGERNPWAQLAHEWRWPRSAADRARWGGLRRDESGAALRVLGAGNAGTTWLGLPDRGLTDLWMSGDERLADSLEQAIRRFRPSIVSSPSLFDGHPDHSAMALAADVALARIGASARPPRLVVYLAHRPDLTPAPTLWVRLTRVDATRQLRAIECIASQLHWRRRELRAFADTLQGFDPPDTVTALRQSHRIQSAWIDRQRLVVDFVRGRWPSLGPLALRLSCDGVAGPLVRRTVLLPAHAGDCAIFDGSGRAGVEHAHLSRAGNHWRLAVPLALPVLPLRTFVKIERPAELAWGFFDKSGWWPVTPATQRTPFPERIRHRAPTLLGSQSSEAVAHQRS